ncbi:MAG: UMP kinase, partial [Candidatus Vogelbacteria bacterium]|nr:UMP kinase [Candidatus Vogelbacteria bacterium]
MILTIKLSGEGLSGDGNKYDHNRLHMIADQIKALISQGHQIGIVIGGGNIFR